MNIKTQFINDLNNKLNLNPNFDDIKNRINVTQYIKEENKNTNLFNLVKTNKTYKIAGLSALAVVLSLGVVLPIALSDYSGGDISGNVSGDQTIQLVDVYNLFYISDSRNIFSFSNLKVLEIEESLYYDKQNANTKFMVVKCEVVEDFYKEFDEKTVIFIPFVVDSDNIYDIKEWLLQVDSLCAHLYVKNVPVDRYINEKTGESMSFDIPIIPITFDFTHTIPIYNGKVDLETIDKIINYGSHYHKLTPNYTDYIEHGMDKELLFENLRRLYYEQLEERDNNENV